jgi:hypothetical protein
MPVIFVFYYFYNSKSQQIVMIGIMMDLGGFMPVKNKKFRKKSQ